MHVTVIFIICMMSVGSMCAPDFKRGVVRDRPKRYLDVIGDVVDIIEDRVTNRAKSRRERERDVVGRTGTDGGILSEIIAKILQPLFNINDAALNKLKLFIQSLLVDTIKEVLNDSIPENLFVYLGLGLGIIAVSLVCCISFCCVGYFTMLKELKKISGSMTDRAARLPSKDAMYVNCLDYRH